MMPEARREEVDRGPERGMPAARVEALRARGGIYLLLGRALDGEVDAPFLSLMRGPLRDQLLALGNEMGLEFGPETWTMPEEQALEALAEEYTALFVAPGAVSPYRSVFESGRLFQPQADLALAAYREAGFDFRPHLSGEFADHIGVMMSFVGRLLMSEAEALEAAEAEEAERWRRRRERFLVRQLAPWAIGWSRRARACAALDFYRAVLALVEQVVWEDVSGIADERTLRRLVTANRRPVVRPETDHEFRKASGL